MLLRLEELLWVLLGEAAGWDTKNPDGSRQTQKRPRRGEKVRGQRKARFPHLSLMKGGQMKSWKALY